LTIKMWPSKRSLYFINPIINNPMISWVYRIICAFYLSDRTGYIIKRRGKMSIWLRKPGKNRLC
jgi:hypothetical protein